MAIYILKESLSVNCKLVFLRIKSSVGLNNQAKESSKLLQPTSLVKIELLNAQVRANMASSTRGFSRSKSSDPFVKVYSTILILVEDLNETLHIW